jgi:hypothetical protein
MKKGYGTHLVSLNVCCTIIAIEQQSKWFSEFIMAQHTLVMAKIISKTPMAGPRDLDINLIYGEME